MRVGARAGWRGLACLALLTEAVTGCSAAEKESSKASASTRSTAETSGATDTVAKSGGTLGAVGSACELPVTFDTAKGWKAEAVDAEATQDTATTGSDSSGDSEGGLSEEVADALLRQGPVTLACEVETPSVSDWLSDPWCCSEAWANRLRALVLNSRNRQPAWHVPPDAGRSGLAASPRRVPDVAWAPGVHVTICHKITTLR